MFDTVVNSTYKQVKKKKMYTKTKEREREREVLRNRLDLYSQDQKIKILG
jgi:hypothetical protein